MSKLIGKNMEHEFLAMIGCDGGKDSPADRGLWRRAEQRQEPLSLFQSWGSGCGKKKSTRVEVTQ